jgi:uncharacterized protein (TIGR02302 family)
MTETVKPAAKTASGPVRTGRAAPRIPGLGLRLTLARAALLWERLWRALWPAATVLGLFLALAFMDILPALPGWLHLLALFGFAGAIGTLAWRGGRGVRVPGRSAARRRLETASGLDHRPLATLEDSLAGGRGDPAAEAVWRVHRRRMAALAASLRVGVPSPGVAGRDPWALRAAVLLLVVIGVAMAGSRAPERLARALTPQFQLASTTAPTLDVWITPPAYTRIAPLFLDPASQEDLALPAGSRLTAHINGGSDVPGLRIDGETAPFERIGPENFRIERTLERGERLAIEQGGDSLGDWAMRMLADSPPQAVFVNPPEATQRHHLQVDFAASDDYGIEGLELRVALAIRDGDEPLVIDLQEQREDPREAEDTLFRDLTPHPWAGMDVRLTLFAKDAAGQTGESETIAMKLPERPFSHPVAIDIIKARRLLTLVPDEPAVTVDALDAIAGAPERFNDDAGVYLSLRSARQRLDQDSGNPAAIAEVQESLWEIALRLEEGDLSVAERDLERAREELAKALEDGAPPEQIAEAIKKLEEALQRYMQALAENMSGNDAETDLPEFDPSDLARMDLQRMLEQIRRMAEAGQMETAKQMLENLERMLQNMRAGRMPSQQAQQMQRGQQIMKGLGDLIQRQTDVLDRTFQLDQQRRGTEPGNGERPRGSLERMPLDRRPFGNPQQSPSPRDQAQAGQPPGPPSDRQTRALEAVQRALRQALGEIMVQLGEFLGDVPQTMGQAEQAMRRAADALASNQPGDAIAPETEALEKLQEGAQSAMQQMARQFGMGIGMGNGQEVDEEGLAGQFRDPLGRGRGSGIYGSLDGRDVKVPEEMELQRARDILEELRRRSGEQNRPDDELDYIDRLLERF